MLTSVIHIYIPLWLDLLCEKLPRVSGLLKNLHSTMVRFIIITVSVKDINCQGFTFHYG